MNAPTETSDVGSEQTESEQEGATVRRGAFPPASPESRSLRYKRETPSRLDRTLDSLAHGCIMLAGGLLVLLIITFGWLVFGRYVLNDTPTWVEPDGASECGLHHLSRRRCRRSTQQSPLHRPAA